MEPEPRTYNRPLYPFLRMERAVEQVLEAIYKAELDALIRLHPRHPPTYQGTEAYMQACAYIGDGLTPLGFSWECVGNQIRYLSPEDQPGTRFRIIPCHGFDEDRGFVVNQKGKVTRKLVVEENRSLSLQLTLFPEYIPPPTDFINIFIIAEMNKSNYLRVYAVIPSDLNESGTLFDCWDRKMLGERDYNDPANMVLPFGPLAPGRPDSVVVPIILREKTGTDD